MFCKVSKHYVRNFLFFKKCRVVFKSCQSPIDPRSGLEYVAFIYIFFKKVSEMWRWSKVICLYSTKFRAFLSWPKLLNTCQRDLTSRASGMFLGLKGLYYKVKKDNIFSKDYPMDFKKYVEQKIGEYCWIEKNALLRLIN